MCERNRASWAALWKTSPNSSVFCFHFKVIRWENWTLPQSVKETRCTYPFVYAEFLRPVDFLSQTENQRYPESVGLKEKIPSSLWELLHFLQVLCLKPGGWYSSKQNRTGGVMKCLWIIHWVLNEAERVTINTPEEGSSIRHSPARAVHLACFPR